MEKFSKKTLLNYVNGAGLYGASAGQVVSFKFADSVSKAIKAAATSSNGSLIFAIEFVICGFVADGIKKQLV